MSEGEDESDIGLSEIDDLLRPSGYRGEKRIGEGTFSSVYSVIRLRDGSRLAVKRLIPTASPDRILLEVESLAAAKGLHNVIPLEFVKRIHGDVLLGMPYVPSSPKFSELILIMDYDEMKSYLKNLFIALAYIHDLGIIHRDIKPANFLYDRRNKRYALCDFGLAQKTSKTSRKRKLSGKSTSPKSKRTVLTHVDLNHAPLPQTPTKVIPFKKDLPKTPPSKRSPALMALNQTELRRSPRKHPSSSLYHKKHSKLKISGSTVMGSGGSGKTTGCSPNNFTMLEPTSGIPSTDASAMGQPSLTSRLSLGGPSVPGMSSPSTFQGNIQCSCFGRPRVCPICLGLKPMKAPRAGTPGFRPPEVLFKYENQTTAVDVWAVGIIMLCILSRSYPFFHAPDDVTALAEMTVLFGSESISQAAKWYGRKFLYEPPQAGVDFQELCRTLCKREPRSGGAQASVPCHATSGAISFLKEILSLVSSERISARSALSHPFLGGVS